MPAPKGGNKGSFKKGNSGGGRKPLPDDIKEARTLSYNDMCRTVIKVRKMTFLEIKEVKDGIEKGTKKVMDMPIGEFVIMTAYAGRDYQAIKIYEDRLWGKAQESIDLGMKEGGTIQLVIGKDFIPDIGDANKSK